MVKRSTSFDFLASQRFYLPEINLVQYRNILATLFGLNDQQISINTANDNLGNIYRQIILEREAYARYLKQLVVPTRSLTQIDEAQLNQKYFERIKIFNENLSFVSAQEVLEADMLLMFAHFFRLQEIRKDALIQKSADAELKEQQYTNQAKYLIEAPGSDTTAEEALAALERNFIKEITNINREIEQTKIKLQEISIRKNQLEKAIQTQTRKANELTDQIQSHEHKIADVQSKTDLAIQRHMRIVRMIDEKKESKRQEEAKLNAVKDKKIQAQAKITKLNEEIQSHEALAESKAQEMSLLSKKLHDPTLSEAEKQQLNTAYHEAETENFIHSMYAFSTYQDNDELEDISKQLSKEESVLEEHIHLLKREIKDLKKQLFETETVIKELNAKKTLLVEEHKKLLSTHQTEESKLKEIISKYKNLQQQEELHYNNMENLNKLKTYHETELVLSSTLIAIAEKKPILINVLNTSKQAHEKSLDAIESMEMAIAKHTQTIAQKQQLLSEEKPGSKRYKKLQSEIAKATHSLANMRTKLQQQQAKETALKNKVDEAQQEVDQANKTHQDIMHSLENIKAEIHNLRQSVQSNKEQAQHLAQKKSAHTPNEYRSHTTQYTTLNPNNALRAQTSPLKPSKYPTEPSVTKPRKS
ncbi:hypothetical protein CC99x_012100 [Candidatus Berkiella cookevillensis]|uniref:Chromosome partition protein Smc n=1 Tax=Candidatus Berkiella cookevillensis TaxID=437022 RepID=A0A0Q9YMP0_9GAMM|nr:hypothetical protein [Candidatus Berkiella cookevillensis]MCS5709638.1 hypothetical protein [Candidatus Berkiella cookevillensis]